MRALGARPRVQPGTFRSGPGQVSVSQDARAAEPRRRRLVKGKDLPAAKKAKRREKQLKPADPPLPPPLLPVDATQATQVDDDHDDDDSAGSLEHADDPAPAQAPPALREDFVRGVPSFDNEPAFPGEMNTGCRQFVAWHNARRAAALGFFTDEAQVIIMNTVPENPIDVLCTLMHVPRRKLLHAFLDELRNERGARKVEKPYSTTPKQSLVDIFSYLHVWQSDKDGRQLIYGDWDYRNAVFKPLHQLISQRRKEESGLVGAAVPLHLDENAQLAESIQGKMDHQSSTIFPEQVELIRMWLRALLKKYEESDFAKITSVPHRGEMDTTGYSDYLYFCGQLLVLHIGANGGHRTGDYAKLATTNVAVVEQLMSQRSVGLWNVDAFVKKNSGRGLKRAPHLIFDRGVNRGVVSLFKLLSDPSKRKPEWDKGIIGSGADAKPGNGIRLFLLPLGKVEPHHAL